MLNYSKNDVVLVRYPFSDLSNFKIRPAIIVNTKHISQDILIVPLTSKTSSLLLGEFILFEWQAAGLNVPSAIKRGIYTVKQNLVIKTIGQLQQVDARTLEDSLKSWSGL
ncbi:MAG: type II toxin-antitoxin system PemK/MazF family toxin [Cyanobacteria bacterium P01_A01_bin.83]